MHALHTKKTMAEIKQQITHPTRQALHTKLKNSIQRNQLIKTTTKGTNTVSITNKTETNTHRQPLKKAIQKYKQYNQCNTKCSQATIKHKNKTKTSNIKTMETLQTKLKTLLTPYH